MLLALSSLSFIMFNALFFDMQTESRKNRAYSNFSFEEQIQSKGHSSRVGQDVGEGGLILLGDLQDRVSLGL